MNFHKVKASTLYDKYFGFENNIDITKDVEVLYRKNVVIKNIIFLSNVIYTIIFMLVSIGEPSNWVMTILFFPLTFFVNYTLSNMINKEKDNMVKQQIGMYMCCFYMFLIAILIYVKLKTGINAKFFGEVGYILLYYSLVVCSFYQDKKLLKSVYKWSLIIITIIHFTLTYNIVFSENANQGGEFFKTFFTSLEFKDIILRTLILIIFMLALYVSVSISAYIEDQRKNELIKRREVEENYTKVIDSIFTSSFNLKVRSNNEISSVKLLIIMIEKMTSLLGFDENRTNKIVELAKIHLIEDINLDFNNILNEDEKLKMIKEKTDLGTKILQRLQLERKCEDIIRASLDGAIDQEFILNMNKILNDLDYQIILLCDLYISLRSMRSYKRAFNHKTTMNYFRDVYRVFFDPMLFDRFDKFSDDFLKLYDDYSEMEDNINA